MVIKEVHKRRCVIREDNYSAQLGKFVCLFGEAKKDFPSLTEADVEIVQFGGDRIKRMWGIEFFAPTGVVIPDSYQPIANLEYKL